MEKATAACDILIFCCMVCYIPNRSGSSLKFQVCTERRPEKKTKLSVFADDD